MSQHQDQETRYMKVIHVVLVKQEWKVKELQERMDIISIMYRHICCTKDHLESLPLGQTHP